MDVAVSTDYPARKAKLREMVVGGHLTVDELRLLKELLRDVTLQTDIFTRIPLELVAIVVQNLGLRDLWACYAVSKAWRARLMSQAVAAVLAAIHFPALVRNPREQIRDHSIGTQFLETLGKSMRRTEAPARSKLEKLFRWHDETLFTIDDPTVYQRVRLNSRYIFTEPLCALSSHGRIAWMPEAFTVCVDSLVTLKRKTFSYPEGKLLGLAHNMVLAGLGSKLVVATLGRTIIAWDLETGQREHASLPVLVNKCTVEGDQVVIAGNMQAFVYRHGGALLGLDISSMPEQHRPTPYGRIFTDAVIHPGSDKTVFVATTDINQRQHIAIHEFTDRKWSMSYEHRMHGQRIFSGVIRLQKANSHGLYAVCYCQMDSLREVPADALHPSREILDGQPMTCATYFNVYHRTFSRQYVQMPGTQCGLRFGAWNGCIATTYLSEQHSTVVLHQSSLEYRARKTPWVKYQVKGGVNTDGEPVPVVLAADDSFLVVANSLGFTAWGF